MSPLFHSLFLLFLFRFAPCTAVELKMIIAPSKTVIEDQKVHVSCYVDNMQPSDMRGFSLHFYCPVFSITTGIACFQNCSSSCAHSGCPQQQRLSEFSCKRYVSGTSLTFEYTIPKAQLNAAGNYRCTFMGRSTETLKLNVIKPEIIMPKPRPKPQPAPPKPETQPPKPTDPPPKPPVRPEPPVEPPKKPESKPVPKPEPEKPEEKEDDRGTSSWRDTDDGTRTERTRRTQVRELMQTGHSLLFVVILLFIMSLLINTIFLIRCVLIWFYGTSQRKVRMGNLLCMSEEIRVYRERTGKGGHYSMLALPFGDPSGRPLLMHHPPGFARQHSADQPQLRIPYPQRPQGAPPGFQRSNSRPASQHSNDSGPRVMRVISEIELQPGEVPEDQTIMYVKVPIMVQKNGSITALNNGGINGPEQMMAPRMNGHAGGRPQSVFYQSGEIEQVGQRARLSTSTSSIDRIRSRSGRDGPERILSMESVFQMEPLHE